MSQGGQCRGVCSWSATGRLQSSESTYLDIGVRNLVKKGLRAPMVASTAFLMTLADWTELRMDNEKLYSEEDELSKEGENTNIEKQQKAAARKN